MKGVMTLIKLHKRALDEKRRVLTNHEDQKIRLMQSLHMVQEVFNKEKQVIDETPEMAYSFIPFAEANKGKQQQLQQLIEEKQAQITTLQEEIQENFGELKKYEIVLEQSIKKRKLKEKRLETMDLDDIAQENFR